MAEQFCRVTLERPYKSGGYRMRVGTEAAVRNPNWDPNNPSSGEQFIPGKPIYYPTDGSYLIAGDSQRDSVVVPAAVAKSQFGDWEAPETEVRGAIRNHTRAYERERLVQRWNMYVRPKSNGSFHPDLQPLGLREFPKIAIRPLDARGAPAKDEHDEEIVIHPFKFFGFEDERFPDKVDEGASVDDLKAQLASQQKQIDLLLSVAGGKSEKVRQAPAS